MLDSSTEGPWFVAAATLSSNSLSQTVHTLRASVHQAAKLVAALIRVVGITAGLVESNGSLPPGLWLTSPAGWLRRIGISSGTLRSAVEYGLPLYTHIYCCWEQTIFLCRVVRSNKRSRSPCRWLMSNDVTASATTASSLHLPPHSSGKHSASVWCLSVSLSGKCTHCDSQWAAQDSFFLNDGIRLYGLVFNIVCFDRHPIDMHRFAYYTETWASVLMVRVFGKGCNRTLVINC